MNQRPCFVGLAAALVFGCGSVSPGHGGVGGADGGAAGVAGSGSAGSGSVAGSGGSGVGGSGGSGVAGSGGSGSGGSGAAGTGGSGAGGSGGSGAAGADGDAAGQAGVSYLGCTYVGAMDRIVIAKRVAARDLCFNVVLSTPGQPRQGLVLPDRFGLEYASVGPASRCPTRSPSSVRASAATGSVQEASGGGVAGHPSRVTVDVTLTFAANDAGAPASELLRAQNVDVQPACQP